MNNMVLYTDALFGVTLVINAGMFLVQLVVLIKKRSATDISLIAFLGFAFIQVTTIIHGYLHGDNVLTYGTIVSLGMCMSVIIAVLYFRLRKQSTPTLSDRVEPNLEEIIALMPANVYWLDRNGVFLGCNNRMLAMLGLKSINEYRGKTYEDFYERTHIRIIKSNDEEVMITNTAKTIEEIAHPYKIYLTNKIPLHNKSGHVIGLLGVSIDITQMKETERALSLEKKRAEVASLAKTEFLYNMRHDIRTPLSNVVGLSRLLLENESNSTRKEIISDIAISAESLMDLLNEMLDFSNIDEGIYPIRHVRFNLKEIFSKIQSMMSASINFKGIDYQMICTDQVPITLIGDAMRTHRILLNLISNAIKFTESGSVTVIADVVEETNRQYYLKIRILDTGIGIPEDKIDFVF